jgi:hypothetical protein
MLESAQIVLQPLACGIELVLEHRGNTQARYEEHRIAVL